MVGSVERMSLRPQISGVKEFFVVKPGLGVVQLAVIGSTR